MLRTIAWLITIFILPVASFASSLESAETVIIPNVDRGWYDETGQHLPWNLNFTVGDAGEVLGVGRDFRNFFMFDLAGVTQPIAAAKLEIYVPGTDIFFNSSYRSPDPSENYELHDVVTSIAALLDGTGGVAAHTDLGSGVVYGSRTMTETDAGSLVEIELNAYAVAALNSANGWFGIGGSLTTLDVEPSSEQVFRLTGSDTDVVQLRLTLIPEPSTLSLLAIGAINLLGYRKAKSHG